MTPKEFIKQRPHLFWYTKNYEGLNEEAVVEATLNYGNWEDVQTLIKIMSMKEVAHVFKKQVERLRTNYNPITANYFAHYFKRHAKINIRQPENLRWKFCKCGGLK